jgi:hypothetical protein
VLAGKINPDNPNEDPVFTVGPDFISMCEGSFNGSIVILSSCYGLYTDHLANEFLAKGTTAFISWNERVSLLHTDKASALLLELLIGNKLTVGEAVTRVTTEVGEDPDYKSILLYYPSDAGTVKLDI